MTLDEKITECVRIWMHSLNLTRTEAGERIGRPKYAMFALLAGHQSWQVRDIQALIRVGCSLPEELKQPPDDTYDVDNLHLTTSGGKMVMTLTNRGKVVARKSMSRDDAINLCAYVKYTADKIDPRRYSQVTMNRLRNISRGQVGTKRPGNGGYRG